jgi:hypothetical protein
MSKNHLLKKLQLKREDLYRKYRNNAMTEKEYLAAIKPLDEAIDDLEMSAMMDDPVLRKAFLSHFQKQED